MSGRYVTSSTPEMNSGTRTWLITGTLVGHRADSRASALRMTRSRPRVEREEDQIVGDHEPDVEGDHRCDAG